jgi:hypothetical protein
MDIIWNGSGQRELEIRGQREYIFMCMFDFKKAIRTQSRLSRRLDLVWELYWASRRSGVLKALFIRSLVLIMREGLTLIIKTGRMNMWDIV